MIELIFYFPIMEQQKIKDLKFCSLKIVVVVMNCQKN